MSWRPPSHLPHMARRAADTRWSTPPPRTCHVPRSWSAELGWDVPRARPAAPPDEGGSPGIQLLHWGAGQILHRSEPRVQTVDLHAEDVTRRVHGPGANDPQKGRCQVKDVFEFLGAAARQLLEFLGSGDLPREAAGLPGVSLGFDLKIDPTCTIIELGIDFVALARAFRD